MITHSDIIRRAGVEAVRQAVGISVSIHTVRSWIQRGSIPGEYWGAIAGSGLASLTELATAAAARGRASTHAA